ncbi:MAG: DUF1573 domain-containing protein [Gemmataceae bacterium]
MPSSTMRDLVCGLLLVGLMSAPVRAQIPAPAPAPDAVLVPWANKFFQADPPPILVHDFGTVPKGSILVHKMIITNIYDVPMQVIDIRKSCSCLEATPPTQLLQPHETAELVLTMNADKFVGPNAQSFFITFGPQYISTAVIQVKANSRPDVVVTPGQVQFGSVAVGTKSSQTVSVKYTGKQRDWAITGVVAPNGPLDVQLGEAGRGEQKIVVALKEDAPVGHLQEVLTLKTNDPSAPLLTVNVIGTIRAPVAASPNKLRFDDVKLGTNETRKVILRASKPFKLGSIPDLGDGLTVEPFPGSSPVQVVTVKFTPVAAGLVKRDLVFPTDQGPVTVTIEAIGVP